MDDRKSKKLAERKAALVDVRTKIHELIRAEAAIERTIARMEKE